LLSIAHALRQLINLGFLNQGTLRDVLSAGVQCVQFRVQTLDVGWRRGEFPIVREILA
jgi:hypothetical protein